VEGVRGEDGSKTKKNEDGATGRLKLTSGELLLRTYARRSDEGRRISNVYRPRGGEEKVGPRSR